MNDNLPDWYDSWKLDNGESDTCECYHCQESYPTEDTHEDSRGDNICNNCAEDYEICAKCGVVIIESDFCHDELCDSCVEYEIDKRSSYDD